MFEATLTQVVVLRKIVESLKDLVTEVNLEATPLGKLEFSYNKHINKVSLYKQWTAPMFLLFLYN
jgi:hypothetical protein